MEGREALFAIRTGEVIAGSLPGWVERAVRDWILLNAAALLENWELAYSCSPTFKIEGPERR